MILIDTNVVSAFMTTAPAAPVLDWLNAQPAPSLYLASISVAEIHYGLQLLPAGKRREFLRERFEIFMHLLFGERVLPFDQHAAALYGEISATRRKAGRPIAALDAQIAAIARSRALVLATRNTKDFEACGIELVDPFAA